MGVLDWLRGKPRDTQQDRAGTEADAGPIAPSAAPRGDEGPQEIETDTEMLRDSEAARHGGI
jgi:hypothetical protein